MTATECEEARVEAERAMRLFAGRSVMPYVADGSFRFTNAMAYAESMGWVTRIGKNRTKGFTVTEQGRAFATPR